MSLPKKFKLINYDWDIFVVDQPVVDEAVKTSHPPGGAAGCCNRPQQTIFISKEQSKQEIPRTLLHEILHACFYQKFILKAEQEEEVVALLEERLTDLIKNNPKLIDYLKGTL